jgi:RHS repeat-associated protein
MKTTINMLLALAAISVNLHAMNQAPPAPLPEFMDKAQLAKWNADQAAARAVSTPAPAESSNQFYTGKPYVADVDGYIYKYRTYNPEMSRWTSADPSGFPDGVNNSIFIMNPVSHFDATGLSWGNLDFVEYFYDGEGAPVDIADMGLLSGVQGVAQAPGGGEYNFDNQILSHLQAQAPYSGSVSDSFTNNYNFSSVVWAMGGGVLSGTFDGTMTSTPSSPGSTTGTFTFDGTVSMTYSDTFSDPLDVIQLLYGSSSADVPSWLQALANVGGTPYSYFGDWTDDYSGSGTYDE